MNEKINLKEIQAKVTNALKQTSKHLEGFGRETKDIVKRGENEFIKISKMGKAQLEILALGVKKEQLYRQIGMKVWQLSAQGKLTTKRLKSFCKELSDINNKVKNKKMVIGKAFKKRGGKK